MMMMCNVNKNGMRINSLFLCFVVDGVMIHTAHIAE